jgi:hypothetical protein
MTSTTPATNAVGTPSRDTPPSLRGQIYRTGITLSIACAFLIGGFALTFGVEELTAVGMAMTTFFVVGTSAWVADLVISPALERVAQQRLDEQLAQERDIAPAGVVSSVVHLPGGAFTGPGAALKGRALDITLPEEGVPDAAPVPASAGSSTVPRRTAGVVSSAGSSSAPASPPASVLGPALESASVTPASSASGVAEIGVVPDVDDFRDLASLLREAAEPVPAAARSRP